MQNSKRLWVCKNLENYSRAHVSGKDRVICEAGRRKVEKWWSLVMTDVRQSVGESRCRTDVLESHDPGVLTGSACWLFNSVLSLSFGVVKQLPSFIPRVVISFHYSVKSLLVKNDRLARRFGVSGGEKETFPDHRPTCRIRTARCVSVSTSQGTRRFRLPWWPSPRAEPRRRRRHKPLRAAGHSGRTNKQPRTRLEESMKTPCCSVLLRRQTVLTLGQMISLHFLVPLFHLHPFSDNPGLSFRDWLRVPSLCSYWSDFLTRRSSSRTRMTKYG